jgi:hypothetical protein
MTDVQVCPETLPLSDPNVAAAAVVDVVVVDDGFDMSGRNAVDGVVAVDRLYSDILHGDALVVVDVDAVVAAVVARDVFAAKVDDPTTY